MEHIPKRSRKSTPVKNAIFLGAIHKGRSRPHSLRGISSVSSQEISESDNKVASTSLYQIELPIKRTRRNSQQCFNPTLRMSTPIRNCDTSPRYRTRRRSKQESTSELDVSASIALSLGSKRRYHPDYDPFIEIRQAKERLKRYRTKDDWNSDLLLSDDADEDLYRYEEKLKRRLSQRGDSTDSVDLERRQLELLRRQKDIDMGKVTERYAQYIFSVPKPVRERHHPRTPNKFRKVSRRAWDGMIRKWRKHLHNFDDLNFEDSWRSLSSSYVSGESGTDQSTASSDLEAENIAPIDGIQLTAEASVCLFGRSKSKNASNNSLTLSSPTRYSNFRKIQSKSVDEDEDTLQANPKVFRDASNKFPVPLLEDENTLLAAPTGRRITRSSRSQYLTGPAPDAFHSGLTNDMGRLYHPSGSQKRGATHLSPPKQPAVDITDMKDFPDLKFESKSTVASPSKRVRRGILSEHGLSGENIRFFNSDARNT